MTADEDQITTAPNLVGHHGRAWQIPHTAPGLAFNCTVAMWIVEAKDAHPHWHSYLLAAVHLRPAKDFQPIMFLPGGTHEIAIWALDPTLPRQPQIDGRALSLKVLGGPNFAAQLIVDGDGLMQRLIALTVREIIAGELSPDTDARPRWAARFGGNMFQKGIFS